MNMVDEDEGSEIESLRLEYETAKARINQQVAELEEFGRNTITRFRDGVVAVGVLLTAISYIRSNPALNSAPNCILKPHEAVCPSPDHFFAVSSGLLALGLVVIGVSMGKESKGIHKTTTGSDLKDLQENTKTEQEYLLSRIEDYEERIADNDAVIAFKESSIVIGGIAFTLGVIGLFLLGYSTITGEKAFLPLMVLLVASISSVMFLHREVPEHYLNAEIP